MFKIISWNLWFPRKSVASFVASALFKFFSFWGASWNSTFVLLNMSYTAIKYPNALLIYRSMVVRANWSEKFMKRNYLMSHYNQLKLFVSWIVYSRFQFPSILGNALHTIRVRNREDFLVDEHFSWATGRHVCNFIFFEVNETKSKKMSFSRGKWNKIQKNGKIWRSGILL